MAANAAGPVASREKLKTPGSTDLKTPGSPGIQEFNLLKMKESFKYLFYLFGEDFIQAYNYLRPSAVHISSLMQYLSCDSP